MRVFLQILATVVLFGFGTTAVAQLHEEGVHFELVTNAAPAPVAGAPIMVSEYFNYSCPACNFWYPSIEKWQESKPDYVMWERVPLAFARWQGLYARTQYVLEAFDRSDLAAELFDAIHTKKKLLNSEERIAEWLAENHGLDEATVLSAFTSFSVKTKTKRAKRRATSYGIQSTPSFVIANRYLLSPSSYGDPTELFKVLDEMVAAIYVGDAP